MESIPSVEKVKEAAFVKLKLFKPNQSGSVVEH